MATKKKAEKTRIEKQNKKGHRYWHPLAEKEILDYSKKQAEICREINADTVAMKEASKIWKSKIKAKQEEVERLNAAIRAEKEMREDDVVMIKNFGKKTVRFTLGGKVVDEREMKADELQTALNLEKKAAAKKKPKVDTEAKLRKEVEEFKTKKKTTAGPKTAGSLPGPVAVQ